jgi:hypothetical protein
VTASSEFRVIAAQKFVSIPGRSQLTIAEDQLVIAINCNPTQNNRVLSGTKQLCKFGLEHESEEKIDPVI